MKSNCIKDMRTLKTFATLAAILALASCGNNADPAYFGCWVYENSSDVTFRGLTVDISADTLFFHEYSIGYDRPPSDDEPPFAEMTAGGYTMSELKWERMDEPKGNAEYPTGYKITGRLETLDSQWFTPHNIYNGGHAKRGEQAFVVLYISPDGKSLVTAQWNRPYAAEYSIPYVKFQPLPQPKQIEKNDTR